MTCLQAPKNDPPSLVRDLVLLLILPPAVCFHAEQMSRGLGSRAPGAPPTRFLTKNFSVILVSFSELPAWPGLNPSQPSGFRDCLGLSPCPQRGQYPIPLPVVTGATFAKWFFPSLSLLCVFPFSFSFIFVFLNSSLYFLIVSLCYNLNISLQPVTCGISNPQEKKMPTSALQ